MSGKIAVVTGANKGIGFEIAKQLAERGLHVVLTARSREKGAEAVERLSKAGLTNAECVVMDVSNQQSVNACAQEVENKHGEIDVLVNNAAIAFKASDPTPFTEQAEPTVHTNYFGVLWVTTAFLPILRNGGKITNVASQAGHLRILKSDALRAKFTDPALGIDQLSAEMTRFVAAVKSGNHASEGFPNSNYGMSKLGLIAMTKVFARELSARKIAVNACCPGYCKTDMSSNNGNRSASQGAETPVWLATLPSHTPTGLFFYDCKELEW